MEDEPESSAMADELLRRGGTGWRGVVCTVRFVVPLFQGVRVVDGFAFALLVVDWDSLRFSEDRV